MPDNLALNMVDPTVDPTGKPRPPLSATKDLPDVIDPKAAPEPAKTEPEPVKAEPEVKTEDKKDDTPAWMKAEITKLRNRERQARREADEFRGQLSTALEALKNFQQPKPEPKVEPEDPRPLRPRKDTFSNPDAYEAALDKYDQDLTEWVAKTSSKTAAERTKREVEDRVRGETEAVARKQRDDVARAIQERWQNGKEKAIEKYPDWEEIAESNEVRITDSMAATMMLSDNGHDVAYYLGKHPEQATKISNLAPALQAMELGRIAERLVEKPQVSKAPPPIKPLKSGERATERTDDELSIEEYAAKHMARINPARARMMNVNGSGR